MRRLLPVLVVVLAALAAAPAAWAGGFVTVGLSSTPAGVGPDRTWAVDITVLQHGRTPVEWSTPSVRIESGATVRTFQAVPTDELGVFRATVVFPRGGNWTYAVSDGFSDTLHTFPTVRIGGAGEAASTTPAQTTAAPPAPDGDGGIAAGWLAGAALALLAAGAILAADRRRPPVAPRAA
jgi:hypothetical protein